MNQTWLKLRSSDRLPGLPALDHYLGPRHYSLYPTKQTLNKARVTAVLAGFKGPEVTLMLGREPERNAKGETVFAYELEAEAAGPLTPVQTRQVATLIGQLLAKAGVTRADQQAAVTRSWAYTTQQLSR